MDLNRLTEKSQEALRQAQTLAARRNHQGVDVEHVFSALVESPEGIVPAIFKQTGVSLDLITTELENALGRIPQGSGPASGPDQVYVTQRLSRVLARAEDEAKELKDEYVSVEHLLLAMLEDDGATLVNPRREGE